MYESLFLTVSVIYNGHGDVFESFTWRNGVGHINGSEERDGDCDVNLQSDAGIIKAKGKFGQIKFFNPGDYLKCKLEFQSSGSIYLSTAILDTDRTVLNRFIKQTDEHGNN